MQWMTEYFPSTEKFCWREPDATGDDSEAEDIVQETLVRAHLRRASLSDEKAALAWLFRIADRVCIDHLRRKKSSPAAANDMDAPEIPDTRPTGLAMAEQSEMSDCTRKYVDMLNPSHREILMLHDVEGRTAAEIAAILGISKGAAKIKLHRARTNLKEQLDFACRFSRDERGVFVCEPKPASLEK